MDLSHQGTRDAVTARLAEPYAGRPVLLGPGVLAAYPSMVAWFRDLGCPVLVVSTARGAGPIPEPGDCQVVEIVPPAAATMTDEVRQLDRLARHLPPLATAAIDEFDPGRHAFWFASPFVTNDQPIDGRPVAFGRPAAFLALEDKTIADAIWEAAGATTSAGSSTTTTSATPACSSARAATASG